MQKKVLIFGGGGRVGINLVAELLRNNFNVVIVDYLNEQILSRRIGRIYKDVVIANGGNKVGKVKIYADVDVLNRQRVIDILAIEKADVTVNYAIPVTWDAAKKLKNYSNISRATLGAFAAVQALVPKIISEAIISAEVDTKYIVGNLPDITCPILHGIGSNNKLKLPVCGSGNVGLIEIAIREKVAQKFKVSIADVRVALVAHHIHWVQPREPGYRNDAPYLMKVIVNGRNVSNDLGDLRLLMNEAIVDGYEDGAEFSSTTGILAAATIMALCAQTGQSYKLHVPAPGGLPGGYPVVVQDGKMSIDLPNGWDSDEAIALMKQAHTRDGIDKITGDGSIYFRQESVDILTKEIGFSLPLVVNASEIEEVAKDQISAIQKIFNAA